MIPSVKLRLLYKCKNNYIKNIKDLFKEFIEYEDDQLNFETIKQSLDVIDNMTKSIEKAELDFQNEFMKHVCCAIGKKYDDKEILDIGLAVYHECQNEIKNFSDGWNRMYPSDGITMVYFKNDVFLCEAYKKLNNLNYKIDINLAFIGEYEDEIISLNDFCTKLYI